MRDVLPAHLDFAFVLPSLCKIVTRLHAYPYLRGAAEGFRQPNSHFGTNARLAINDFRKGLPSNAEYFCAFGDRQS